MSSDLASISSGEYRKQGILDKINALKQRAALAAGEPTDPAFENSFGDRLSDIDGRRRWVLVGLALQKWHQDLQNRVGEVLREKEGEIYKGRSIRGTAMTQHCWMVGYDRTCAHPTVVISCGQSTVLKRTMRAISQHGVLKAAKFALKGVPFCDLKLRMESRGDSLRKWDYDLDEDNHDLDTSVDDHVPLRFGAEEIIVPHSGKATTLGGFLMVDDVCFGLTAAHTFSEDDQNLDQGSIAANDTETQLYDSDWANGDSDDNPDDSVLDFDSSRKTTQEQQLQRKEKNRIATHQTYESSRGETLRIKAKSRLFSANGLDWALCELGDWGKYAINGVYLPPELRGPDASEYLIFTQAKTTPPLGKVLVATRRGAISGLGTGSDCSIKLGSDDRYRHVWSIQLEESLFSGDSGSWVVDATTGDVYGIIMAGSTGSREEFIIPAVEIGQDICRFMRADTVRLPNLQDVMAARTEHVSARRSTKSSRDDALGWETDESADILDENPLDEKEKRSLLAEILKHSSIDAEALAKVIRDAEIRPKWTEVALPEGRSLRTAQRAVDLIFSSRQPRENLAEDESVFTRPGIRRHGEQSYVMEDSFYTNEDPEAESESESESEESDGEINAPLSEEPPELLDSNPNFRAETSRRAWRAKRRAEKGPKPHYRRHRPVFPGKRSGEGPEADALTQAHGPFEPDSTRSRTRVEMNSANEQGDDNPDIIILKHKGSTYTLKFPPFSIAQGSSLIGHLRQRAAKEFGVEDASRVTLVYKGKTLKTDNCTCHEEGLRMKSEVLCVIKRTPLEELDFLSNKFRSELLPQGLGFISNTPVDSQRRDFEYKKISETVMTQILFKLDALDINGDESARYIRKEIVKEATGFLERLDRAMKHADFFPQKEESKSIDARHSLPNRTSLTFSSSLRRSTTRDDDDPEFSPDQG